MCLDMDIEIGGGYQGKRENGFDALESVMCILGVFPTENLLANRK